MKRTLKWTGSEINVSFKRLNPGYILNLGITHQVTESESMKGALS